VVSATGFDRGAGGRGVDARGSGAHDSPGGRLTGFVAGPDPKKLADIELDGAAY
jgi:hypothetical protein